MASTPSVINIHLLYFTHPTLSFCFNTKGVVAANRTGPTHLHPQIWWRYAACALQQQSYLSQCVEKLREEKSPILAALINVTWSWQSPRNSSRPWCSCLFFCLCQIHLITMYVAQQIKFSVIGRRTQCFVIHSDWSVRGLGLDCWTWLLRIPLVHHCLHVT